MTRYTMTPTEQSGALLWRALRKLVDDAAQELAEKRELHLELDVHQDEDGVHIDWKRR